MFDKKFPTRSLAVLLLSVGAALTVTWAGPPSAKAGPAAPSTEQIAQLQSGVRNLLDQLQEIDELHDEAQRRLLIARHWLAVQAYMRNIRDLRPPEATSYASPLLFGSAAECRLPATVTTDGYVSRMRDTLWVAREHLADAYSAKDPAQRLRIFDDLSRSAYQSMQLVRVFGWMNGSAVPITLEHAPVPESASEPAYLVRRYCGQCHAPPPTALHSANEWSTVTSKMSDHIRVANSMNPLEIERPDPKELNLIVTYLEAHGCETKD